MNKLKQDAMRYVVKYFCGYGFPSKQCNVSLVKCFFETRSRLTSVTIIFVELFPFRAP